MEHSGLLVHLKKSHLNHFKSPCKNRTSAFSVRPDSAEEGIDGRGRECRGKNGGEGREGRWGKESKRIRDKRKDGVEGKGCKSKGGVKVRGMDGEKGRVRVEIERRGV